LPPKGLHLTILLIERIDPLMIPNLIKHSLEYSEQVGEYRHVDGRTGEIII